MQIHLNNNANPVAPPGSPKTPSRAAPQAPVESAPFAASQALNDSLAQLPAVRPEVVEKAKRLLLDSNYPPEEAIRKISNLLAINLSSQPDA